MGSRLLLASISFALLGCATSTQRRAGELPAWYLPGQDVYSSTQFLVGRGACGPEVSGAERLACATQRATEDALLSLRANVTAVHERACALNTARTEAAGDSSTHAESACRSLIAGRSEATLQISNAVPRHQACDAQQCYALVALSRAQLSSQVERSSAAQRDQFQDFIARSAQVDLLSGMSLLAQAEALAPSLDAADALLFVLENAGGAAAMLESSAARVVHARRARWAGTSACLIADRSAEPSAERVFTEASAMLSEQGMNQVQLGVACTASALCVEYAPLSNAAPVPKQSESSDALWTVSYAGRVRVSIADQGVAREREVQARGVARSVESARRDAEDRLSAAVREALAELVLGHAV